MDWEKAFNHLQEIGRCYVVVEAPGVFGLTIALNPLLARYERGERTQELYDEMLGTE